MEKVLKKYTTIPQHLYVVRYADKQLKQIIEEMQRPGYVLVARQMGKTNLLFNAKRTLENENRLFAYVDLSNLYTNERDCYRNIVDNIIDPNLKVFDSIEVDIERIRDRNLPPHNEYSRCLIRILEHFQGDLVVILDEIDALKSIPYSDNIFAQIRSNYFSRTNYPVLERLTYVLSGVIEPTELIKDKNKSPFNIGDKIYLDDFTYEEHKDFINKSKLQISEVYSDEIFSWTNGNPRLTFDICAEVENLLINNVEINSEILKDLIQRKYLTSYDIAPIDHIRELARSNKDIRKAILSIYRKKSVEISDDIKKKLYLYGIITSKFNSETYIKNKIIELSLSEDWIKSIDKEKEVSYIRALAMFHDKDFEGAVNAFEEIVGSSKEVDEIEGSNYFLGMSHFKLQSYKEAISYFSYSFSLQNYSTDSLGFLGVSQIVTGDISNGLETLNKAIEIETNSHSYHTALLNLALNIEDKQRAFKLLDKLYESTFKTDVQDKRELIQLRTLSLYYQADLLRKDGDVKMSLEKIDRALEVASLSDSLFLLFTKSDLIKHNDLELAQEIVSRITKNDLRFEDFDLNPINFQREHIYYYLDFSFQNGNLSSFEELLEYSIKNLIQDESAGETIYRVSSVSSLNRLAILEYLLNSTHEVSEELLLIIRRDQLFLSIGNDDVFSNKFNDYFLLFKRLEIINDNDIYLFVSFIKILSERKEIRQGIDLSEFLIEKIESSEDEKLKYESVIVYYWCASLSFSIRNKKATKKYTDIALTLINESNGKKISMIDEAGLKTISNQLSQMRLSAMVSDPIIVDNKIKRNDKVKVKYTNGQIKTDKYKRLEADILSERCVVI